MSIIVDGIEIELDQKELLEVMAQQLLLISARVEAALETGIEIEDIEDGA